VHASDRAEGVERIYVPGEIEHQRRDDRLRDGIPLPTALVAEMDELARNVGLGPLV